MTRTRPRTPDEARGYALIQIDSVFVGVVAAAGTFLPVFLVRLGASGTAVGLLTAIPAFGAFTLAIPFGRWLQSRRKIVPWYSRLRLGGWLSYGVMGVAAAVLPANVAVPVILAVWAAASLPAAAGLVAFPIVMDGAAGPHGRFDLLGRRWAISGVVTSITVVVAGQALTILRFPTNFEWLFVAISLAGVGSYVITRQIVLPDQETGPRPSAPSALARIRVPVQIVRANPSFVRFEIRSFVYTASTGFAMPLLPLFYVHEMHAPNGWIGIIGASQSTGAVIGYLLVRRLSRRRSGAGFPPRAPGGRYCSGDSFSPVLAPGSRRGRVRRRTCRGWRAARTLRRTDEPHPPSARSDAQLGRPEYPELRPYHGAVPERPSGGGNRHPDWLARCRGHWLGSVRPLCGRLVEASQPGRHELAPSPGTTELSNAIEPADGTAGNI